MWVIFSFLIATAFAFNEQISYKELLDCKEFRSSAYSHNYNQFFRIDSFENSKPMGDEFFRIKFYMLATNDMWIVLSESPQVTKDSIEIGKHKRLKKYKIY